MVYPNSPSSVSLLISLFSAEKAPLWNPFGRPGAGAPNTNEIQSNSSVRFLYLPNK